MTEENRTYITQLKVTDVPWHRLTTAYGRGTDFPAHLAVLERMEDMEAVKESLYELTTNMEHQGTLWHTTPFGMVFLTCSTASITTPGRRCWPIGVYWNRLRQSLPNLPPQCWNVCKGGYTDVRRIL